ncbi:Uncharacterised protein [Oligella urethralis]|uniref:hypothetical protein n=1 Tax=Oligella urethralis TaxID=90245 RepID=UPI000DFC1E34|nr:hypothetical protein [Oligella urethralis]SUA63322.1 Uncharacterised protein [Oligella urethralis]
MGNTENNRSFLEMSDEEILNSFPPDDDELLQANTEETDSVEGASEEPSGDETQEPVDDEVSEGDTEYSHVEVPEEEIFDESNVATSEKETNTSEEATQDIDYEGVYKQIFAPFKANGTEFSVQSPEEVISLMQMGANYNKKMMALKPSLSALRMLEKNNLLSEEKLAYLIDLNNKNPDAIGKLIRDSGLDTYDIDTSEDNTYRPDTSKYAISEAEMAFQEQVERLENSPTFSKTINVIANEWDEASSKYIATVEPKILGVINAHMESGIFDIVSKEVQRQRVFGNLTGESDLEAYRKVGDMLNEQGAFDHLSELNQSNPQVQSRSLGVRRSSKPSQAEAELRNKKRAVSPTRQSPSSHSQVNDFNPLAMSDEEFMKLVNKKYM